MTVVAVMLAARRRPILMGRCQVDDEAAGGQHQNNAHASQPRNR